jgi:hypothetical protein
MLGNLFTIPIVVPGTLAANITVTFTAPVDCQLIQVSATGSGANDGKLTIGYIGALEAYLAAAAIGDSNSPVVFTRANFVGTQYPKIAKGTVVNVGLDFDGDGGTATPNFTCLLTFLEG